MPESQSFVPSGTRRTNPHPAPPHASGRSTRESGGEPSRDRDRRRRGSGPERCERIPGEPSALTAHQVPAHHPGPSPIDTAGPWGPPRGLRHGHLQAWEMRAPEFRCSAHEKAFLRRPRREPSFSGGWQKSVDARRPGERTVRITQLRVDRESTRENALSSSIGHRTGITG